MSYRNTKIIVGEVMQALHEAKLLKLCCDKAHTELNWYCALTIDECLQMIAAWYKKFYMAKPQESMYEFCTQQIAEYVESARKRNLIWTGGQISNLSP